MQIAGAFCMVPHLHRYPIECKRDEAKSCFFKYVYIRIHIYIYTQEFEETSYRIKFFGKYLIIEFWNHPNIWI